MRGIIFDVDGTLVDSNDEHALAYVEAFYFFGYSVPFERVRPLIGMGGDKLVPTLVGRISKKAKEKINKKKGEIFKARYRSKVKAFAGVEKLFQFLAKKKIKIGIATSASKADMEALLKKLKIAKYVDASTDADDIQHSKPSPEVIEAALKMLKLSPREVLMVGDTPFDLLAAKRAGVFSIAFRTGNWADSELKLAEIIYDDPKHFLLALSNIFTCLNKK